MCVVIQHESTTTRQLFTKSLQITLHCKADITEGVWQLPGKQWSKLGQKSPFKVYTLLNCNNCGPNFSQYLIWLFKMSNRDNMLVLTGQSELYLVGPIHSSRVTIDRWWWAKINDVILLSSRVNQHWGKIMLAQYRCMYLGSYRTFRKGF